MGELLVDQGEELKRRSKRATPSAGTPMIFEVPHGPGA
jgi:hypothetical protein